VALLRERRIPEIAGNYDSTGSRAEELSHESYGWT
jgi:hypothetical protein